MTPLRPSWSRPYGGFLWEGKTGKPTYDASLDACSIFIFINVMKCPAKSNGKQADFNNRIRVRVGFF